MAWPIISEYPEVQRHYEDARNLGTSHSLAEMFALGEAPCCNTDTTFLSGHTNGSQFEHNQALGDQLSREAQAAGINTKGKVYLSGLAAFPGDPEAWVDGKADVERVCRKRGWSAEGDVNVPMPERTPSKEIDVADDILDREVTSITDAMPDGDRVDKLDLKEQVLAKRKPRWAK